MKRAFSPKKDFLNKSQKFYYRCHTEMFIEYT